MTSAYATLQQRPSSTIHQVKISYHCKTCTLVCARQIAEQLSSSVYATQSRTCVVMLCFRAGAAVFMTCHDLAFYMIGSGEYDEIMRESRAAFSACAFPGTKRTLLACLPHLHATHHCHRVINAVCSLHSKAWPSSKARITLHRESPCIENHPSLSITLSV